MKRIAVLVVLLVMLLTSCGMRDAFTYRTINTFILFDHIVYNGVPYYMCCEQSVKKLGVSPMMTDPIEIVIVDDEGEPFDEEKKEEAWRMADDPDGTYVYYLDAVWTKNKEDADSSMYDFGR